MRNETFEKIAKIIGAEILTYRRYSYPYEGGYIHTTDGEYMATDARRIVLINGVDKAEKDVLIDYEGDEWEIQNYKEKFKKALSIEGKEIIYEWKVDLGKLIVDNEWMKAKADTNNKVTFTTKFNHYRKGNTERVVNVEDVVLNHFNVRYLADVLRIYRAIHKNRTKSMVVKMTFTRSINEISSPCSIEALDGSFKYVVMPLFTTNHSNVHSVDVIEAPVTNIFK
jgi:hypothetical protein